MTWRGWLYITSDTGAMFTMCTRQVGAWPGTYWDWPKSRRARLARQSKAPQPSKTSSYKGHYTCSRLPTESPCAKKMSKRPDQRPFSAPSCPTCAYHTRLSFLAAFLTSRPALERPQNEVLDEAKHAQHPKTSGSGQSYIPLGLSEPTCNRQDALITYF